ncbi:MAG TPA: peptidase M24 family protein, partial [Staphylococcus sp.]|nr:peptidase M24 family protein [Staphylococcus sp.]
LEPGIYVDGLGGVRIEDDVLVTKNGLQRFTKSSKDLIIL